MDVQLRRGQCSARHKKDTPGRRLPGLNQSRQPHSDGPTPLSVHDAVKVDVTPRNGFRIGTWNVRSLNGDGKIEILDDKLLRNGVDVVGLTETHLPKNDVYLDGRLWNSGGKERRKGVGLWINPRWKSSLKAFTAVSERLAVGKLVMKGCCLCVVICYAPTSDQAEDQANFLERVKQVVKEHHRKQEQLVILGDFNAKIGRREAGDSEHIGNFGFGERNPAGEVLLEACEVMDVRINNTFFQNREARKVTWASPDGRTRNMIDYVMTGKGVLFVKNCRAYPGIDLESDHQLVVADCGRLRKTNEIRKSKPTFDRDALRSEQGQLVFKRKIEESKLGGQDLIASLPVMALDVAVKKRIRASKPYVTKETLELVQRKQEIGNLKGRKSREYKDLSNEVKKRCREEKEKWLNDQCADIDEMDRRHQSKAMITAVKRLTGHKRKRRLNGIRDNEGNLLTDDVEIDQRWEEYIAELFRSDFDNMLNDGDRDVRCDNPAVLRCEVEDMMRMLKNGKSEDADGLAAELLKCGGEKVVDAVHEGINEIWTGGVMPISWKRSEFVAIPKPAKSRLECGGHRTVAIISLMSKMLMMIARNRLNRWSEETQSEAQYGFRPGRGTTDAIVLMKEISEATVRRKENLYCAFVDFTKAFDRVPLRELFQSMRSMGAPKGVVDVVESVYDGAEARMKGTSCQSWIKTPIGCRQGCPLSPLLFNSYLEATIRQMELKGGVRIGGAMIQEVRYADDVALVTTTRKELEENLKEFRDVCVRNGMEVNWGKTKIMVMQGKDGDEEHREEVINIGDERVEVVQGFQYLGRFFSKDGEDMKEMRRRCAMVKADLWKMSKLMGSGKVSNDTKDRIFNCLCLSKLMYGCESWRMNEKEKKMMINAVESCYARMKGNVKWTDMRTNTSVFEQVGMEQGDLLKKVIRRKATFVGHISRMNDDRLLKKVWEIRDGHREVKRGRRRTEVDADVTKMFGYYKVVKEKARDRETWREDIRKSEMPEAKRKTLTMTLRSQRGKPQD